MASEQPRVPGPSMPTAACPVCGARVPVPDAVPERRRMRCGRCEEVFPLGTEATLSRRPIAGGARLVWRPRRGRDVRVLAFAASLLALVAAWLVPMLAFLAHSDPHGSRTPALAFEWAAIGGATGLALALAVAIFFVLDGRVTIDVTQASFVVRSRGRVVRAERAPDGAHVLPPYGPPARVLVEVSGEVVPVPIPVFDRAEAEYVVRQIRRVLDEVRGPLRTYRG